MVHVFWKFRTTTDKCRGVGGAKLESLASPSSSVHPSWKQPGMVERARDVETQVLSVNPQ